MEITLTIVSILLAVAGFIGSFLPIVPGPALILVGAVINRAFQWETSPVSWFTIILLALGVILSAVVDFFASLMGAKKFGASKWGIWGALLGAIVGLFLGIPGLILGPIVGALGGELIAGKKLDAASKASFGTLVGTLAGMVGKVAISACMMALLITDLFWNF